MNRGNASRLDCTNRAATATQTRRNAIGSVCVGNTAIRQSEPVKWEAEWSPAGAEWSADIEACNWHSVTDRTIIPTSNMTRMASVLRRIRDDMTDPFMRT